MVVSSFFVYLYRKKQDTDKLQQLIVQKRELLARETFSRRAFNRYEDMSDYPHKLIARYKLFLEKIIGTVIISEQANYTAIFRHNNINVTV